LQQEALAVFLRGQSSRELRAPADYFPSTTAQVRLLRVDGTSLKQTGFRTMFVSNAGSHNPFMFFAFERVPPSELAGAVVSVNGKLFSYEIPFLAQSTTAARTSQSTSWPVVDRLSDEIFQLVVSDQNGMLAVQMSGLGTPYPDMKLLKDLKVQAWILAASGRVVPLKPVPPTSGIVEVSQGGGTYAVLTIPFERVPVVELTGIAVSVDGKLHVREIRAQP
jgi:hypothetical protein